MGDPHESDTPNANGIVDEREKREGMVRDEGRPARARSAQRRARKQRRQARATKMSKRTPREAGAMRAAARTAGASAHHFKRRAGVVGPRPTHAAGEGGPQARKQRRQARATKMSKRTPREAGAKRAAARTAGARAHHFERAAGVVGPRPTHAA